MQVCHHFWSCKLKNYHNVALDVSFKVGDLFLGTRFLNPYYYRSSYHQIWDLGFYVL